MDKFIKGTLFSPEGNKVYEGEFIDNYPKEGKNITIYNINGNTEYIGDLFNGKYNGYGKLFETKYYKDIKYEGLFKDGLYHGLGKGKLYKDKYSDSEILFEGNIIKGNLEGNGILYYEDGKRIFYDGTFKANDLYGKGIIYYINNYKKFEGIFDTLNKFEGIYYNPQGAKIYEGLIINEMPQNSYNGIIYNNYCYKIYEGEIKDGAYNGKGVEFSNCIENLRLHEGIFINNYCIDPYFKFENEGVKVVIVSKGYPGKTCLLHRLIDNYYLENFYTTIGIDFKILKFEFNHNEYKFMIWDTNGCEKYRHLTFNFLKKAKIVIYLIDLTGMEEGINKNFLGEIKSNISKETLIYLVGNKLDLVESKNNKYKDNLMACREQAKLLIENKDINFYFEVSAKNNKGIDILKKNIKWYILRDIKCHQFNFSYNNKLDKFNKLNKLNKYMNM